MTIKATRGLPSEDARRENAWEEEGGSREQRKPTVNVAHLGQTNHITI